MNKLFKHLLIGLSISVLGFLLQMHGIEKFPPIGDTMDEIKGAFNGISLIKEGIPKSWSWFKEYGDIPLEIINGREYKIVAPYFDDPPVFALISGGYALSQGMDNFSKVDILKMRYPMPFLGMINIFLLFSLVYLLKGTLEATITALIYATTPTVILGSRLPVADNALITITMSSLILFIYFTKTKSLIALCTAGTLAGLGFLMKSTGIYIGISLVLLSLSLKNHKASVILIQLLIISIGIWFLYGAYYNWELFAKLLPAYSGRFLFAPTPVIDLFSVFRIGVGLLSVDGWIIWGWICIILYTFLDKSEKTDLKRLILPITVGCYLTFFSIMSGFTYGWYRFPFYPFLSWASAFVIIEIIQNPRFLPVFFFLSLPVSSSYIYGTGGTGWNQNTLRAYQIFFVALMSPVIFYELFQWTRLKKIVQIIMIIGFILSVIFNIVTILFFQDYFWNRPQPWPNA